MDCEVLFGKKRIASYLNAKEHNKNLRLIGRITPRLAATELIIRNRLDFYQSLANPEWIFETQFDAIRLKTEEKYKQSLQGKRLDKYQYLSNLTLGELKRTIINRRLGEVFADEFGLDNLDFKKLAKINKNSKSLARLPKAAKFYLVLELLRVLRNRSFHWENILKVDNNVPRIRAFDRKYHYVLGLHPRNIEYFLDFLLSSIDKSLLKEFKTHP